MPFGLFIYSPLDFLPYCVLGLLAFAEGPIATLLGGAASSSGLLLPVPVYLAVVMGNLTADMGWYTLGRFCKQEWLARLAPRVGISHQRIGEQCKKIRSTHAVSSQADRRLASPNLDCDRSEPCTCASLGRNAGHGGVNQVCGAGVCRLPLRPSYSASYHRGPGNPVDYHDNPSGGRSILVQTPQAEICASNNSLGKRVNVILVTLLEFSPGLLLYFPWK
jgi:hypothetical protein